MGSCAACRLVVLAYPDPVAPASGAARCVHCDGAVELLGTFPLEALEAHGYGFVDVPEKQGHCATKGYCTMKARGEGEGCGNGSCGSAGGGCAGCH